MWDFKGAEGRGSFKFQGRRGWGRKEAGGRCDFTPDFLGVLALKSGRVIF